MKKKIFVIGSSGLTGYKTVTHARSRNYDVYGTFNVRKMPPDSLRDEIGTFFALDFNKNGDGLKRAFTEIKPDVVVNCTALHNVDYCELNPSEAYLVNSQAVGKIATLCNIFGSRFIHISTDFVFDGEKSSAYLETDNPNPLNLYAESKLAGEIEAKQANSFALVRTSVVYGWTPIELQGSYSSSGKPMNFALWAINQLKNKNPLQIVDDQYSSPTLADILGSVCVRLANSNENGIYHVSGSSCNSRYEFTRKIAEVMGYSSAEIKAIQTYSLNQEAKRPRNSCLNCQKVQRLLNFSLPDIEQSLFIMRSQMEVEAPSLLGN
ncbi:MAG: dTDP-4-dehydrorhamnose reductase [Nitrososphaeraceae archaeon]